MMCWIEKITIDAPQASNCHSTYSQYIHTSFEPDDARATFEEEVKEVHKFTKTSNQVIIMQLVTMTGGDIPEVVGRAVIDCQFANELRINWNELAILAGQEYEKKEIAKRFGNQ